jgi:hypothetical protein
LPEGFGELQDSLEARPDIRDRIAIETVFWEFWEGHINAHSISKKRADPPGYGDRAISFLGQKARLTEI